MEIHNSIKLTLFTLMLSACGGGNDNPPNSEITELEGTWRSNCVNEIIPNFGTINVIVQFTISGNKSTQFKEFFDSDTCTTSLQIINDPDKTVTLADEITTATGDTANRLNFTYTTTRIQSYGIYKKEDNTVLLWVNDDTKRIDDNNVMRFNELRYDVIFTKQNN